MVMQLPEKGRPWAELEPEMQAMRGHDLDWKHGRHGAFVWYANDELEHVLRESFGMFLVENGLGVKAFPSIGRMENEVLAIVRSLLGGDEETAGIFTSGGTESIFQGITAMREWARKERPDVRQPEIVAPHSAHPALNKAAHLLGMEVRRVPVGADYRADPAAIAAAIGPETVGLYASAPSYSLGMVDPIPELGAIAAERGLWLHVDACVGGILAPFVREVGYEVPPFDFSVPGVASISADLHKSGYAAKPASTVTFRTRAHREFARYTFDDWPSGIYSSLTFTGTRPGGAIAAAWAALNFLGREGYREIAAASMRAKARIIAGLSVIDGLRVHGAPPLYAFAYGVEGVDMGAVAVQMIGRGWYSGRTTDPDGIHVMATPVHEPSADEYVAAVAACIDAVRRGAGGEVKAASYT
ncbi:MAG: aminotransferase class V-fold PLP-dependent enzyme [Chloroflexi bacterium]|nr:aminotransferase class V-fold PLP-dependent enzyme [Chloroflexota bacterium]PWB42192.1 MAG: aspartate aminotransferase family protein [Dehalococcoidia bacterium]